MTTGTMRRAVTGAAVLTLMAGCSIAGQPTAGPQPSSSPTQPATAAPTPPDRIDHRPDDILAAVRSTGPGTIPTESTFTAESLRIVLGEPVLSAEGSPIAWLAPAVSQEQWSAALRAYPETGLWPVLVDGLDPGDLERPWRSGELDGPVEVADDNAAVLLPEWWATWTADDTDNVYGLPEAWPGLAAGSPDEGTDTITIPAEIADALFSGDPYALLLVPTDRPADVVAALGWWGATNYLSAAEVSTVLRRWEASHGAIPVVLGFDYLGLYVERPPTGPVQAARTAAEHFAFAPDNIWQGEFETFDDYVYAIDLSPWWAFWWD